MREIKLGKFIFGLSLVIGLPFIFLGLYFIGYGLVNGIIALDPTGLGLLGVIIGSLIIAGGKRTMRPKTVLRSCL